MCGRFTLTADGKTVQLALGLDAPPEGLSARYNIAPTQPIAVVTQAERGALRWMQWGLVPHWSKDGSGGAGLINARAETAHEKPSFRDPMRSRRCLIPSDGWYEWQVSGKHKTPMYVHLPEREVFAFAGLWDTWQPADGGAPLHTCTILTTDALPELAKIHHRMPIVLRRDDYDLWLNGDAGQAPRGLLKAYDAAPFTAYAVSERVNKPINDSPENLLPSDTPPPAQQLSLF